MRQVGENGVRIVCLILYGKIAETAANEWGIGTLDVGIFPGTQTQ